MRLLCGARDRVVVYRYFSSIFVHRIPDACACVRACMMCVQMSMTALDCSEKGIVFTAVHDSYWTHACDVDRMNDCLRNQFVNLYQLPLLEQLRDSLVIRFPKVCGVEFRASGFRRVGVHILVFTIFVALMPLCR